MKLKNKYELGSISVIILSSFTVGLTRTCCLHIADGLNGWSMGIQNLLQMIFGTPLLDIVGLEAKLLSERSKYLVAELKEASGEEGK